ncbi:MAG: haloalkane dehalogenase [Balneolaceae bacterium]|nr:haloalkane dehalogenase [Balneolaceae bacterium]
MISPAISSDFPFDSNYVEVYGSRMHYIDTGDVNGSPVLFLHGNPTSSYLWRNIIPHMGESVRCIAPDLIGMGKSGKPEIPYRFMDHYRYLLAFIEQLNLKDITLVVHDWGSGLGFHYASQYPDNVRAVAFLEAIIDTAEWKQFPAEFKLAFRLFRTPGIGWMLISVMNLFVEKILPEAVIRDLSEREMQYYRAPFKRVEDRKPVWAWPQEIPIGGKPEDMHIIVNNYNDWFQESDIPKLLFHAYPGGIIRKKQVNWCKEHLHNLQTLDLGKGIHYLQEDHPHAIGRKLSEWVGNLK